MDGYKDIIDKIKPEFEKVIGFMERELSKIRTSRASSVLVEDVVVDYFGTKIPLKQLATISIPGPRQILIHPWDKSSVESIEKAISQSNAGLAPIVDKESIRISLPPLSNEYRQTLLKVLSEKQEEARKTMRRWRDKAWDEVQEMFHQKKIREDDKFRAKDELEKLAQEYKEKIEKMGEQKKQEVAE